LRSRSSDLAFDAIEGNCKSGGILNPNLEPDDDVSAHIKRVLKIEAID